MVGGQYIFHLPLAMTMAMIHQRVILFSAKGLCYRPQSYVIVHRAMLLSICYRPQIYVIVHGAMLSSTGLCDFSIGFLRAMLSSTELCYRPQSYVIGALLSL